MTKIKRYKSDDELTIDEMVKVQQAEAAGAVTPRFETAAYKTARADALRDAGLTDEADELDADDGRALSDLDNDELGALSVDEIADRLHS